MSDYLTVRIFVPYFTFNLRFQKETKDTLYCLSVWNVVKDHLACQRRNRVASRKRVQRYSFFLNYQTNPKKKLLKNEIIFKNNTFASHYK